MRTHGVVGVLFISIFSFYIYRRAISSQNSVLKWLKRHDIMILHVTCPSGAGPGAAAGVVGPCRTPDPRRNCAGPQRA